MTSVDDLFKKPSLPSKRKPEQPLSDPKAVYKSTKVHANGDAKSKGKATVEEEEEKEQEEEGPQLPAEEDGDDEEGRFFGGGIDEGTKDALDYIDEQDTEPFVQEKIDLSWLRKKASNFDKAIAKNAELRAKFEDDPEKFMGSEADLDDMIKSLSIVSEHSDLYTEFTKQKCPDGLVALLTHENTDISIGAVRIINELTDEDVQAPQEQWDILVNALLEADLISLLSQNIARLDESEEADREGVYNSLSVLENLSSHSSVSEKICKEVQLLNWLLARMQKPENPVSQNKQYAAEILSILLQSSRPNRLSVLSLDATDHILQSLAAYRKRDPQKDTEEEEYVENLFDALICLVEEGEGKAAFLDAEGVELCLIMLREGRMSKPRAIRTLDHAAADAFIKSPEDTTPTAAMASDSVVTGNKKGKGARKELAQKSGADVCTQIVEAAGLKTLFKIWLKESSSNAHLTEHLLGIFAALLRSLPSDSGARIRTLAKLVEKDYQNVLKLIQHRRVFSGRLAQVDAQIKDERTGMSKEDAEELEDEWLSRRLDGGLFGLQLVDIVLAWLIAEDDGASKKIKLLLADKDEGLNDVKNTLQAQVNDLEEAKEEQGVVQKEMLETLIGFLE